MHRFFCPGINISHGEIAINDKNEIHHIKDVLRFKVEDRIVVFDGRGNEYAGSIKELSNESIVIKIKKRSFSEDIGTNITVACAIPKADKMDGVMDKLTQLGVARIIPLRTQRTVVVLNEKKERRRRQRWQKIIVSAAKQSKRNTLPVIDSVQDLETMLFHASKFDLKIIPTLSGETKPLKELFIKSKYKHVLIIIGPERDFTVPEVSLAKRLGCIPVSLGDLVLRVDTAAISVASFIRLHEDS